MHGQEYGKAGGKYVPCMRILQKRQETCIVRFRFLPFAGTPVIISSQEPKRTRGTACTKAANSNRLWAVDSDSISIRYIKDII